MVESKLTRSYSQYSHSCFHNENEIGSFVMYQDQMPRMQMWNLLILNFVEDHKVSQKIRGLDCQYVTCRC